MPWPFVFQYLDWYLCNKETELQLSWADTDGMIDRRE